MVLIPKPGRGTVSESRIPSWQRDTTRRRPPKLWEEFSFLHKPPSPWNSFEERMGFGLAKNEALFVSSTSGRWDLENLSGVTAIRTSSYPYPQQVSKVNSLWSIE